MSGARRGRAALAAALVSLLCGCGVATSPSDVTPAAARVAAQTLPRSVLSQQAPPTISPQATQAFGGGAVQAACAELVDFVRQQAFPPRLLLPPEGGYTSAQFSGPVDHLTAASAAEWRSLVARAVAGDSAARDDVRALQFYDLSAVGGQLALDGAGTLQQRITSMTVGAGSATSPELVVVVHQSAQVPLLQDGTPVTVPVDETATYHLVPAPAGAPTRWQISSFDGDYDIRDARAHPGP